jgi:hypothetical protein
VRRSAVTDSGLFGNRINLNPSILKVRDSLFCEVQVPLPCIKGSSRNHGPAKTLHHRIVATNHLSDEHSLCLTSRHQT